MEAVNPRALRLADFVDAKLPRPRFEPPNGRTVVFRALAVCVYIAIIYFAPKILAWWNEAHGDSRLARPTATECSILEALIRRQHSSGDDTTLARTYGGRAHEIDLDTLAISSSDSPGSNVHSADWRWCAGLWVDVRYFGWARLDHRNYDLPSIAFARPRIDLASGSALVDEFTEPPLGYLGKFLPGRRSKAVIASAYVVHTLLLKRAPSSDVWEVVPGHRVAS